VIGKPNHPSVHACPTEEGHSHAVSRARENRHQSQPYCLGAILGPRTMPQLDDLLAGADIALSDEILDQIDELVAPGANSGPMGAVYAPVAVTQASLRRRPAAERRAS
jgi:hypothetical protein